MHLCLLRLHNKRELLIGVSTKHPDDWFYLRSFVNCSFSLARSNEVFCAFYIMQLISATCN